MVTKKKPAIKKEIKKEVIEEKIISSVPYKPVFPPMEFKFTKKVDANYYGIKQYLKNYMGIDLFRKLKNGIDKPKKEEKSLWVKYCDWWNNKFNGDKNGR